MTTDRYDAFISYNHAADDRLAPAVESGLQRLAKPWYQLRAMSVYRDVSDTGLSPSLWGTVQQRLAECGWLILFACPESAASPWVEREVTHWCDTKGIDHLLVVQTGGELVWDAKQRCYGAATTALSPTLARRFTSEPKYLDLRWAKAEPAMPTLHNARFRNDIADVVAAIRGTSKEEIVGEDARLQRKARRLAKTAVATVVTLAIVASIAAVVAVRKQREAEERTRQATARQLGLFALDMPASDIDQALLLSVAATDLDTDGGAGRYQAVRTLLGRYSHLTTLLPVGEVATDISVRSVTLSPAGQYVAAVVQSSEGGVRLVQWDRRQPDRPAVLALETEPATTLGFGDGRLISGGSPGEPLLLADGGELIRAGGTVIDVDQATDRALVARDGTVELVDLSDGSVVATWTATPDSATGAITGNRAAVVIGDELSLVDTTSGDVLSSVAIDGPPRAIDVLDDTVAFISSGDELLAWRRGSPVASTSVGGLTVTARQVAIAEGGKHVVIVGDEGTVVYDTATMDQVTSGIGSGPLLLDPTRRYAAVGGTSLTVWDTTTLQRVIAVPDKANAMAWSACADRQTCRLVVAGESIDVWDPVTGRRTRLAPQTNAQSVGITDRGETVVSAGWGQTVALWSLDVQVDDGIRAQTTTGGAPAANDGYAGDSALSDGANSVEVTRADRSRVTVVTGPVDWMRILTEPGRLVTVEGSVVRIFDTESAKEIAVDPRCTGDLVAVSPNGRVVALHRSSDGQTVECTVEDGEVLAGGVFEGAALPAERIAVDDDGAIAIGGAGHIEYHARDRSTFADGTAVDVRVGRESVEIRALALHRGRIVVGLRSAIDRTAPARVGVWDAASGSAAVQFDVEHTDISAVDVIDDGERIAVAGRTEEDGDVVVQLYEADTLRPLGRGLGGLVGDVVDLSTDDFLYIWGTDMSGQTFGWVVDDDPRAIVCGIVGRALTEDEWNRAASGALARYDFAPICDGSRAIYP